MLTQLTGTQIFLRLYKVRLKGIPWERDSRILQHGQKICYSLEGDITRVEGYMLSKKLTLCFVLLVSLSPLYMLGVSNIRSHVSTAQERFPGDEG